MKKGWETKALGEVTSKIGSGATPPGGSESYKLQGISLVRSLNIHDLEFRYKDLAYIDDAQAKALDIVKLETRDVLINITGASIARCAVVPENVLPARVNQHVAILRPKQTILDSAYLAYLLVSQGIKDRLLGIGLDGGSTRQALTKAQLQDFPIPLPPLKEQQRIVAILNEAFEGLDRARANAEANLQNARELLSASLEAVFARLPESTPVDELHKFCTDRGITYGVIKLGEHDPNGVPCLRTSNVRSLRIDVDGVKLIASELSNEYRRTILEGGEVLVNVRGTLGGVCAVPDHMAGWNISREVAMVPVDSKTLDPTYASFFISTQGAQGWLTGVIKGAAYKGINLTDLRLLKIPVPSLALQSEITAEITSIREQVKAVGDACATKLKHIADLRQSLLQKAFAGELS